MELVSHDIVLPTENTRLYFHFIGDVHYEAVGADIARFRRDIARIKRANDEDNGEIHYWFGIGDINNGISTKDRRFDATAVSDYYKQFLGNDLHRQVSKAIARDLEPIAAYCLGYLRGNHEDAVIKYTEYDPAADITERLNVNYLGYSAGIRLRIKIEGQKQTTVLTGYIHHGTGASPDSLT